jgi:hypothetical protein
LGRSLDERHHFLVTGEIGLTGSDAGVSEVREIGKAQPGSPAARHTVRANRSAQRQTAARNVMSLKEIMAPSERQRDYKL